MSKVFIVRLSRYSIYKVQCLACRSRGQLDYSITTSFVCQELFSSFFKLFSNHSTFAFGWPPSRGQLQYVSTSSSICQELFSSFFKFLFNVLLFDCLADSLHMITANPGFVNIIFRTKREPQKRLPVVLYVALIRHRRSNRSHLHFCDRQQQRFHRYPHHGTRRSYGQADSSEEPLPLWSWA